MSIDLIIKESKISGKGVFANKQFRAGEVVIKWDISNQLTKEQVKNLKGKDRKYLAFLNDKIILQKSPAKYVNHSCNPNTAIKNFSDVAIRDIKKGEEITSDYSNDLEINEKIVCNCGSLNCKKIISK